MTAVHDHEMQPPAPPDNRPRGLRALVASVAVSSLGDGAFLAAAPLAAAAITHSPAGVATVAVAEMAPWLVVTPLAGALVDRWPHRAVMVTADFLRGGALAVLAGLVFTGAVTIPSLAVVAAAVMIGMTLHDTALQAATAELAGRNEPLLNRTNGRINASTTAGKELVAPPAASAVFGVLPWAPFVFDAVSFVVSGLLLATIPPTGKRHDSTAEPISRIGRSIAEGVLWLIRHRRLRIMCLLVAISNLCYFGAMMALLVLYVRDELHVGAFGYGLLLAAGAVGGVIGGITAARIIHTLGDTVALAVGLIAEVAVFTALTFTTSAWVTGVALAVGSAATAVITVVVIGARQRLTPAPLLGRVTSAFRTVGVGAMPLGAAIGGTVASVWGLRMPLAGGAMVLSVALAIGVPILIRSGKADVS